LTVAKTLKQLRAPTKPCFSSHASLHRWHCLCSWTVPKRTSYSHVALLRRAALMRSSTLRPYMDMTMKSLDPEAQEIPRVEELRSLVPDVNATPSDSTLSTVACTSCQTGSDKSACWTSLLHHLYKNGYFVNVPGEAHSIFYDGLGKHAANIVSLPPGFLMQSGDSAADAYNSTFIKFGNSSFSAQPVADRVSFVYDTI
jgi:hypothetical protein